MEYSPFDVPPNALRAKDLSILREVREGWYVEYKRGLPTAKQIAKSISSFANTYGGWLCFGVQELVQDGKKTGLAGEFVGISEEEVNQAEATITNAARLIRPIPYFEFFRVSVSDDDSLTAAADQPLKGRVVLLVRTPEGVDTPYIHPSGRIYRRVADQSDPVEETDRAVFDALHQRSQRARAALETVISRKPEFSKGEGERPYLELFLFADKYGGLSSRSTLSFEAFRKISIGGKEEGYDVPCENVFTSNNGYVGRQSIACYGFGASLTVSHTFEGTTRLLVPLRFLSNVSTGAYKHLEALLAACAAKGPAPELSRLLDLNYLIAVVSAALKKHHRFCKEGRLFGPVFAKARLHSVWRKTPFLDTDAFVSSVMENGLPIIQESEVLAPPGTTPDSLRQLVDVSESEIDYATINAESLPLVLDILQAVGVSLRGYLRGDIETAKEQFSSDLTEVFEAVNRAIAAA